MSIVLDGSNGISLPVGTLGNPSLKSQGDADTGLFFPSANVIALSIDGSQKATFHSNGLSSFEAIAVSGNLEVTGTTNLADIAVSGNLVVTGTTTLSDLDFNNPVFSGNVSVQAQGDVRFEDTDSSNFVALQAPSTVASNVTFTLPAEDASENGDCLVSDASGNLSFSSRATTGKAIAMAIVFGAS